MNFKLGENFGDLLLQVAQEYIIKGDPEQSLCVLMNSMPGLTKEQALDILKGNLFMKVGEDQNSIILTDEKLENYHLYDWKSLIEEKLNDLFRLVKGITETKNLILAGNNDLNLDFSDSFPGDTYALAIDLHLALVNSLNNTWDSETIDNLEALACSDLKYIEDFFEQMIATSFRYYTGIKKLFDDLKRFELTYSWIFLKQIADPKDIRFFSDRLQGVYEVLLEFANDFSIKTSKMLAELPLQREIKKYSSYYLSMYKENGMLESNILDGYDAGWLSTDGTFYGKNGNENGLLHLQIADNLCNGNKYKIPKLDSDRYFEHLGWIKIHNDRAYGYFRYWKDDTEDEQPYAPTKEQLHKLNQYAEKFYSGVLNFNSTGVREKNMKEVMQMDEIQLHKLFEI